MDKSIYLYYSGATDKTGAELAKKLGISGGTEAPPKDAKIIIGWGAKTTKAVDFGKTTVFNHPNAIRVNRNKFEALKLMQAAKVAVAPFVAADDILADMKKAKPTVQLPLIARTNFHQGGNEFFTCLTKTHVLDTVAILQKRLEKAGYFQNYIDVKDEYRLHIFNGELIVAARKTPRDNIEEAYKEQQAEKIGAMADKKGEKLDKKTLDFALNYQAGKIAGPDNIIKSNTRGYKFVPVAVNKVAANLIEEAKKAVKALGLAFGAVDCVLDSDGKAWVLEVNSGPGLEGTAFDAYVTAFKKLLTPKAAEPAKTAWDTGKAEAPKMAAVGKKTATKADQLRVLADLVEVADDKEADVINNLAKKLFG